MKITENGEALQAERLMLESWLPVAQKHASESDGAICVLDVDPMSYPEQRLDEYHTTGNPIQPESVSAITSLVNPKFDDICQEFYKDPASKVALDQAGEILDAGENVIVATNHTELIDVAVAQAAIYNYLQGQGHEFSNGLVISKMISLIGSNKLADGDGKPMPAVAAVKMLCDDIYMSYPKTATTSETELSQKMPEIVRQHNRMVSTAIAQKLGEGGMLLAMCPSGTTDKLEKDSDTCVLQPVQAGTAKLMSREDTYILPVAANFGDNPFIRACDTPERLSSADKAHTVMQSIARSMQANSKGVKFQYDQV